MHQSQNLNKYQNKNIILRHLLNNFFKCIDVCVKETDARAVIEAGCGEGFVIRYLSDRNPSMVFTGVDISAGAINYAKKINPATQFLEGNIYHLPFTDASFDLVVALEVLEHLDHPNQALEELRRLTRQYCLISVPHEPWFSLANLLGGRHIKRLGRNEEHIQFWSRMGIKRQVAKYFSIVKTANPFPWTVVLAKKISR